MGRTITERWGLAEMKILHLTLKKKWFDLIASGKKTAEYREFKTYWIQRLMRYGIIQEFEVIHFRNGYKKDSPFMRACCRDIAIDKAENRFVINLGEILEIRNHKA